ncbi:MAG TPA: hypothetical protein VE338_05915, partial [Ktedonobacterales bacterium]|nr:hypothetical protein [Ktedonobacterales bacterium]
MMTTCALPAERVRLIRPLDPAARDALRRLTKTLGARVERGSILLGGQTHAALLAIDATSGVVFVALLLPASQEAQEAQEAQDEAAPTVALPVTVTLATPMTSSDGMSQPPEASQ